MVGPEEIGEGPDGPWEPRLEQAGAAVPSLEEICVWNPVAPPLTTHPSAPAIHPAAVYACTGPRQADQILGGQVAGYAYQRDGHPNADRLAEKCRRLHRAQGGVVTSSGMSALACLLLATLRSGDHVVLSDRMYGRSSVLVQHECSRLGIVSDLVDTTDLGGVRTGVRPGRTKLVLVETVSNPLLRVADIPGLAEMARTYGFQLAVDNTFATPYYCRPLELGADWVWESFSKMLNGHGDVMLGMLCGGGEMWERVKGVVSTWGLAASPWDCYMAERGLMTFPLRMERASENAARAAAWLSGLPERAGVKRVHYPGLAEHPEHDRLDACFYRPQRWLGPVCLAGNILSCDLDLERLSVEDFLAGSGLAYFPSLGDCATTVSHPASSSHRHLDSPQRQSIGLEMGTIRLSFGVEPWETLSRRLAAALLRRVSG